MEEPARSSCAESLPRTLLIEEDTRGARLEPGHPTSRFASMGLVDLPAGSGLDLDAALLNRRAS